MHKPALRYNASITTRDQRIPVQQLAHVACGPARVERDSRPSTRHEHRVAYHRQTNVRIGHEDCAHRVKRAERGRKHERLVLSIDCKVRTHKCCPVFTRRTVQDHKVEDSSLARVETACACVCSSPRVICADTLKLCAHMASANRLAHVAKTLDRCVEKELKRQYVLPVVTVASRRDCCNQGWAGRRDIGHVNVHVKG
jgi:hypothetical protein